MLLQIINQVLIDADKPTVNSLAKEMSLRDDLNLSSLELASLTVAIEDKFGVDIFEKGVISTVGEILSLIERK